jgi:hypothetical protein
LFETIEAEGAESLPNGFLFQLNESASTIAKEKDLFQHLVRALESSTESTKSWLEVEMVGLHPSTPRQTIFALCGFHYDIALRSARTDSFFSILRSLSGFGSDTLVLHKESLDPKKTNAAGGGHRSREMEWRRTHQEEMRKLSEQWVALEGETILAHGSNLASVVAEARKKGVQVPYVFYVEPNDDAVKIGL